MGVIVIASAKGAPGATTTALALAAAWPGEGKPLVVEADPAGGDLRLRFGLCESPGLVSLAAAARRAGLTASLAREHAQCLPGGVEAVLAPVEAAQCRATLDALGTLWAEAEFGGTTLLVDLGRLPSTGGAAKLPGVADAVVLVSGGSIEALAHAAEAAQVLGKSAAKVVVAVVGSCPWPAGEVASALGVVSCVMLPDDTGSAALLKGARARERWRRGARHPLLNSARELALALLDNQVAEATDEYRTLADLRGERA
jgi:MinD-like ATPase involved in chromosome partitioning or flagellar assembly